MKDDFSVRDLEVIKLALESYRDLRKGTPVSSECKDVLDKKVMPKLKEHLEKINGR